MPGAHLAVEGLLFRLRPPEEVIGGGNGGGEERGWEGVADGNVQCQIALDGSVGDEDVGGPQEGRGVDRLLPRTGHAV